MLRCSAWSLTRASPHCAEFCCNGTVVDDTELGQVIQLQGDQRKNASTFLVRILKIWTSLCPTIAC